MSWKFREVPKSGAERALDACDYFVDEVIEPWKIPGILFYIWGGHVTCLIYRSLDLDLILSKEEMK